MKERREERQRERERERRNERDRERKKKGGYKLAKRRRGRYGGLGTY